jgi:hypothetical protein
VRAQRSPCSRFTLPRESVPGVGSGSGLPPRWPKTGRVAHRNRLHWVRDVTLREDAHQARTGNGPAVAAVLRNTAIGFHRSNGEPNIARATRRANRRPIDLIDAVTRSNTTTQ